MLSDDIEVLAVCVCVRADVCCRGRRRGRRRRRRRGGGVRDRRGTTTHHNAERVQGTVAG
jgi:hypothetical protein